MKSAIRLLVAATLPMICLFLGGCLFRPTTMPTRSFVLTALPVPERATAAGGHLALGVGLVKMPAYLLRTPLVVRHSETEIEYLENALWAERLDQSFQRALAADLSALVPTDQVRLSSWQPGEVALAVHVNVDQFDVDEQGQGNLTASWRITGPGADRIIKSSQCRLTQKGAPPQGNPQHIASTLSTLTGEFSRAVAQAVRDAAAETAKSQ